jgi:glycosyltransferase involved in cell wall biosynthesis
MKSVEAQTYQDYIHVIVNDGGDKEAVNQLVAKFNSSKIIAIHNKASTGLVKTLNQGITAVDSDYVAIFDDDDTWSKDRLAKTLKFLDSTQAKAVVVPMDIVYEEVRDGVIYTLSQVPHPDSRDGEINLYKQCLRNYISNGVVTYRREVYDELGGYDESLETSEDWDFGVRLLLKYDVELLRSDAPLFFYHQRPKQKGVIGNSVHAGVHQQERTLNIIRNKYLRKDLNDGVYGVGVIMNQLTQDVNNIVRLEGHMNFVGDNINRHVTSVADHALDNVPLSKIKNRVISAFASKSKRK